MSNRFCERIVDILDWILAIMVVVVVALMMLSVSVLLGYVVGKSLARFAVWVVS